MNKKILDYIKTLTKNDSKTLSQKTLKFTEELGELAKVILPYENAFATNHRFVDRAKILEELADNYLVLMSILYDMSFSDEELEQMVSHKMKVWADLQARERRIKYPIPYEIHITVKIDDRPIEVFKAACIAANVKPILLDLHLAENKLMQDLMTSSTFLGNNKEAFLEMKRISSVINEHGFEVVREKIETIPWHPAAPSIQHQNPIMPENCYFESHLATICNKNNREKLEEIVKANGAHLSRNTFKKLTDDDFVIMITFRSYTDVFEVFKDSLEKLKKVITDNSFGLQKEIIEFSIYDTKMSHDSKWILSQ